MELIGELSDKQEPTLGLVREALSIVQSILERNDQDIQRGYQASVVHEGSIGRPRFDVLRNQLACLLEKRFTVPQIADIIGASIRTVRRRMTEYDLSVHALYIDRSATRWNCEGYPNPISHVWQSANK